MGLISFDDDGVASKSWSPFASMIPDSSLHAVMDVDDWSPDGVLPPVPPENKCDILSRDMVLWVRKIGSILLQILCM